MSNERDIPDHAEVTAAYRDLATETAPESLNEAVLREASKAATKSSYASMIGWTRPVAWAATVGLTLFITLQLADTPTPNADIGASVLTESLDENPVENSAAEADAELRSDSESTRETDAMPAVRQRATTLR